MQFERFDPREIDLPDPRRVMDVEPPLPLGIAMDVEPPSPGRVVMDIEPPTPARVATDVEPPTPLGIAKALREQVTLLRALAKARPDCPEYGVAGELVMRAFNQIEKRAAADNR